MQCLCVVFLTCSFPNTPLFAFCFGFSSKRDTSTFWLIVLNICDGLSESHFVCSFAESWRRRATCTGALEVRLAAAASFQGLLLLPLYNGRLFIKVGCIDGFFDSNSAPVWWIVIVNLVACSACVSTFGLVLSLTRLCLLIVFAFLVI